MSKTFDEYLALAAGKIQRFPAAQAAFQIGDNRFLAQLESFCAITAALDAQAELAGQEYYLKARDSTVLADAALKGIYPMASPARGRVRVQNNSAATYSLDQGRVLLDSAGRVWRVDQAATIPAGVTGTAECSQRTFRTITDTVTQTAPFYRIEVVQPDEDSFIAGCTVQKQGGNLFQYRPEFVNTLPGEETYKMESDEQRRLYVQFGYRNSSGDVVAYQPANGDVFILTITDCSGDVRPTASSPFTFENTTAAQEADIALVFDALLQPGFEPTPIPLLREFARYPSVYRPHDAVYLGEFEFLVRANFPNLQFLSVWNEQVEELVRGPSVDNINVLFVAFTEALGSDYTATRDAISRVIRAADDSYRIRFVQVIERKIQISATAKVSYVNDPAVVRSQVEAAIKAVYGATAAPAKLGLLQVQVTRLFDRVRADVSAMRDAVSDLQIMVTNPTQVLLPEWRQYVDDTSLAVTVTQVQQSGQSWGA